MKLSLFDYKLPKNLIAQCPTRPRDHSRLLVLDRTTKETSHCKFYEIEKFLQKGDILVLNNSKVIPARLYGRREGTGGKLEIFLLRQLNSNTWECLVGGRRARVGLKLKFSKTLKGELFKKSDEQKCLPTKALAKAGVIKFNKRGQSLKKEIYKIGHTPTPPYIKSASPMAGRQASSVKQDYQTVYAKVEGSVAAPTAGFHFTKRLINRLKKKGVQFEFVALHVGLGTFAPVKTQNIEDHKMHPEFAILDKDTCKRLNQAKKQGQRIIAVGTTSVRVLESATVKRKNKTSGLRPQASCPVNLFIYPGYKFKFVDCLITNFHLPKSTLLMLVSAFAGRPLIMKEYQEAIKRKYRFYSFGDAMFIKA
ncbi:tRNA preQ1(34) S-adenosylmethionine ribosyltransferase-isomerase QueA [Patescibacteria group bacterium]|nr:tRNA preQ1(34) S-adenosylmethionine ribosyltransferase-isomerase QueA [Patescibacteria group bacterium]MBU4512228.1 tRNA preQ1(34) S-adenosylmethionine ribosyltransferase-isomerase QueA [Patescibacteria group bacterium]MCG2692646.1 tRNA preQ1(34) S-adenosylmethionine ribosyltransferase-isomerase QueA [Candidatus Parcubacteria bacterium]